MGDDDRRTLMRRRKSRIMKRGVKYKKGMDSLGTKAAGKGGGTTGRKK